MMFRPLRNLAEHLAFWFTPAYQGDTLPPIFHYWTNRHFSPFADKRDIRSPEQFYFDYLSATAAATSGSIRIVSFGSGACHLELALAERLHQAGADFSITCIDFNGDLLAKANQEVKKRSLSSQVSFFRCDCNALPDIGRADVVIVNQFFHHVERLEAFCSSIRRTLRDDGVLLTSDVIGRNGHLLWPDVARIVDFFWDELPPEKRMDAYFGQHRGRYEQVDHSAYSNEGIRAQDIMGSLAANFDFELFLTFGAAVIPFIERRLGFNFDPENPEDTAFIDRVSAMDRAELERGAYPASNMIAALRHKRSCARQTHYPFSPAEHLRLTRRQQEKTLSKTA